LVERVQPVAIGDEHAIVVRGHAAMAEPRAAGGAAARIELPELPAGRCVQRDHLQRRRGRIEHAADDHGVALHLRTLEGVVRIVGPCDLQPGDVLAIDLRQRRIANVVGAAVHRPAQVAGGRLKKDRDQGQGSFLHSACSIGDADCTLIERLITVRLKPDTTGPITVRLKPDTTGPITVRLKPDTTGPITVRLKPGRYGTDHGPAKAGHYGTDHGPAKAGHYGTDHGPAKAGRYGT